MTGSRAWGLAVARGSCRRLAKVQLHLLRDADSVGSATPFRLASKPTGGQGPVGGEPKLHPRTGPCRLEFRPGPCTSSSGRPGTLPAPHRRRRRWTRAPRRDGWRSRDALLHLAPLTQDVAHDVMGVGSVLRALNPGGRVCWPGIDDRPQQFALPIGWGSRKPRARQAVSNGVQLLCQSVVSS